MNQEITINDVFGISRNLPLNYVERRSVDDKLRDNIERQNHIVIFGSSKQGKTCLRKNCLDEDQYIVVQCLNNWSLFDLHSAILKQVGYEIALSNTKSYTGKNKISATIGASFAGIKSKIKGVEEKESRSEHTSKTIDLDPEDPNDIISALKSIEFNKYIVLEDFHYLPVDTQENFATVLKAFHESSDFCFIIVGVWLDENRLIVYNGDLTGRVISVNADNWNTEELSQVIDKGADLLNIKFSDSFKSQLIKECYDSVYIVQETCREVCKSCGINEYQTRLTVGVGEDANVLGIIKEIVSQQDARYIAFLTNFSEGFQTTTLEMHKWLLYTVLNADQEQFERGLSYGQIKNVLQEVHPRGEELNLGNLTLALKSIASLQSTKSVKPFILDYNETDRKLNIVDKGFYIWLNTKEQNELFDLANIELESE